MEPVAKPIDATATCDGSELVYRSRTYQDRYSPSNVASGPTIAGNAIPIKATHTALVWHSVKVNKSEIKEFTIRNTSKSKIKIQVDILDNSKSFKVHIIDK